MHSRAAYLLRLIQAQGLVTRDARDARQLVQEIRDRAEGGVVHRAAEVVSIDEDARTVELAFSSETPVNRWWGEETLSHDPAHVRMARLNDGAAFLWNHDWDDQRGVVESARIDADRRGRAVVRFGTSAAAEELWQDVKNRIKRHISVGYFIHAMQLVEVVDGYERWMITDWEPYEISSVSVPADTTVGIGRSAKIPEVEPAPVPANNANLSNPEPVNENRTNPVMFEKIIRNAAGDLVRAKVDADGNIVETLEVIEKAGDASRQSQQRGTDAERTRVKEINSIAERFGRNLPNAAELARAAVESGASPSDFTATVAEAQDKRMAQPLDEQTAAADIGLNRREVSDFSLLKVVRSLVDPGSKSAREAAAMEFRASEAAAERMGRSTENFVIPAEVLRHSVGGDFTRAAMSTSTSANGNGGLLVEQSVEYGSFVSMLRKRATIMRLGRVLGGLVGNIDIPRQTAGGNGYWIGEGQDAQETGMGLGMISLKPKTVAAYTDLTRRLRMQSSMDVEAMLRSDLATSLALVIDTAGYYGTGTEFQPKGIVNHDGINGVNFANTNPTHGELVDMETAIALDDADVDGMQYVAAAGFRGYAKQTLKFQAAGSATIWEPGNSVNGYGCAITNQIAAGDVIFGNFADLIVALWGSLELNVDTAALAKSGGTRLIAFQDVDFAARRVESFCLGRKP